MMNREEALQEVAQHQWWPNADTEDDMLPHTPAGWDWVIQFGKRVLVHSIHDPITRADCEKAQQTMLSTPATEPDMVNHPPHYQSDNGIECIDAIRAALGRDGFIAYCRGNAIKYLWRDKVNNVEDRNKAIWYINRANAEETAQ